MSSQSIVLLIMGVAGSGKTELGKMLSKRLDFTFADADDYHCASNKLKMKQGMPLTDEDRIPWLIDLSKLISEWLADNKNAILACSALKETYRQTLIRDSKRIKILFLKANYNDVAKRLKSRQHEFMNPVLLRSQFDLLEEPKDAIFLDAKLSPSELADFVCEKLKNIN